MLNSDGGRIVVLLLKRLRQAGLLHDAIGGVSRKNLVINREVTISKRAVPHFMVTLSRAHNLAFVRTQNFLNVWREVGHARLGVCNALFLRPLNIKFMSPVVMRAQVRIHFE